ncbi:MAG: AGE family epimerase/isomerase [Chitinophagaceae bacterium]
MTDILVRLKKELEKELVNILHYWMHHSVDEQCGGFYGRIDNNNRVDINAPKGLVLNARILWSFSAAYNHTKDKKYLVIAERAWQFLMKHFLDKQYGGFYWSIDKDGNIGDSKKQIYGIAFCLYGFSEYYKATNNINVLRQAKYCYYCIEQYSFDKDKGGYIEAFTRNWEPIKDLRLSAKDANEKKTMNTHLHVLEAYANLYKVWNDEKLRNSIRLLLENFIDHIINHDTGHLQLFFDEDWKVKDDMVSYGHDIEAAWLLLEAAETISDEELIAKLKSLSVKIALAAAKGLDIDGGLWYEVEHGKLVAQKHSWPQAEALVGFFNAWQLTTDKKYLQYVLNNWQFIQQYILDKENGEWFWGINRDHTIMEGQDKAGFWKCPYHNSRACMEVIKRIPYQNN